jgi:hypothetical protein
MRVPQHCFALSGLASEKRDSRTQAAGLVPQGGIARPFGAWACNPLGQLGSRSGVANRGRSFAGPELVNYFPRQYEKI